jgi:hypothetical protein
VPAFPIITIIVIHGSIHMMVLIVRCAFVHVSRMSPTLPVPIFTCREGMTFSQPRRWSPI